MIASAKKFVAVPSPTNNTMWTCTPIESSWDEDVPLPLRQLYLKNCLFLHRAKHRHAKEKCCRMRAASTSSYLSRQTTFSGPSFVLFIISFPHRFLNWVQMTSTSQLNFCQSSSADRQCTEEKVEEIEANKSRSKSGRVVVVGAWEERGREREREVVPGGKRWRADLWGEE